MPQSLDQLMPHDAMPDIPVMGLKLDSRTVQPGDLFLAVPGTGSDGRQYIDSALAQGAAAVLYEESDASSVQPSERVIGVVDLRQQVGELAARFYGEPSNKLTVVAVTGTNGKTSVSQFIAQSLQELGYACGVIGTMGVGFPGELEGFGLTTPDPISVQKYLADLLERGAVAAVLEASSHGLEQGRLNGTEVGSAIFTNITRDHLDYHASMEAYQAAKSLLFEFRSVQSMLLNIDDDFGRVLSQRFQQKYPLTFSRSQPEADLYCELVNFLPDGLELFINTPWGKTEVQSSLLGDFNVLNLLATLGVLCRDFEVDLHDAAAAISRLKTVPGRMDAIRAVNAPVVVIDYAHTPDALDKALTASRLHCDGQLWCVFGCGGDRDHGKRPIMGEIAASLADHVVVTDDNPRGEDPALIAAEVTAGIETDAEFTVLLNRREAIQFALSKAEQSDLILLAGKGHETYQEIAGERLPFSDYEEVYNHLGIGTDHRGAVA